MADQQADGGGAIGFPLSATVTTARYSNYDYIPANSSGSGVDVHCPSGARVVGGGFVGGFADSGSGSLTITASMPGVLGDSSAEGWKIYADNTTSDPQGVYVYLVCIVN